MKCQAIMKKNMNSPQRKAITIQPSSVLWIGSFHQIRCSGGVTAMSLSPNYGSLRIGGYSASGIDATSMMPQIR